MIAFIWILLALVVALAIWFLYKVATLVNEETHSSDVPGENT